MSQVLVLTKKVENELPIYGQLRNLGYDAFLSQETLDYWQKKCVFPSWIKGFPIIIFSETIPIKKIEKMINSLNKKESFIFLLKVESQVTTKEMTESEYFERNLLPISTMIKLSELGELLEKSEELIKENTWKKNLRNVIGENRKNEYPINLFISQLDRRSREFLLLLFKNGRKCLSREEISMDVWGQCTNATLSQLSLKVKNLNYKIHDQLGVDKAIVTEWRKGYRLDEGFFNAFNEEVTGI